MPMVEKNAYPVLVGKAERDHLEDPRCDCSNNKKR
jgi:hypothetical protein